MALRIELAKAAYADEDLFARSAEHAGITRSKTAVTTVALAHEGSAELTAFSQSMDAVVRVASAVAAALCEAVSETNDAIGVRDAESRADAVVVVCEAANMTNDAVAVRDA